MSKIGKRKICVFTGGRAEYGLLSPLMNELKNDKEIKLQILVSGMHLSLKHGLTYKEIEKDGFVIDEKVDISLESSTNMGVSKSIGLAIIGMSNALNKLNPDIVIVLGDRFEALAVTISATVLGIPVAHIHGGESTFGVIDEAFRHSITKMSVIHFTSTEEYRRRVIQLGENPKKVFNVGSLGIENIRNMRLLSKKELCDSLAIEFNKKNLLVTFHPITTEKNISEKYFKNLLLTIDKLKETNIVFTKSNADVGGDEINNMIDYYVRKNPSKAFSFYSLGQKNYFSLMQYVDAMAGNSSSGIIEAASFGLPVVNIGDRQKGRARAKNVIDAGYSMSEVQKGINKALSSSFRKSMSNIKNPYEKSKGFKVSSFIKNKLKNLKIDKSILKKEFYDIKG